MPDDNLEILIRFGQRLKALRKERRFSLLELEVRSGINEGDISRIENGKKNLTLLTIIKLSRGLELPAEQLMSGL
jgi:HTH-type transcriptional regulator, competence development regulator